jgi:hypothetical protein
MSLLKWFKGKVRRHRIHKFFYDEFKDASVSAEFDDWGNVTYFEMLPDDCSHDDWWEDLP